VKAYVSESSIVFASLENNRDALEALKRSSPEAAAVIDQALNLQLSLQERMVALYQLSSLPSAAAILGGELQTRLQSLVATGAAASTASN
jgi:DNA-binding transcriptional regulator YbjK